MTIRKGEDWGELRPPTNEIVVVSSDAELRHIICDCRNARSPIPTIGLLGGDLMRTLGGSGDRSRLAGGEPIPHLPIDLVRVVADEQRDSIFVAHLIARRSWWRGQVIAAMNAQFLGNWDVAPRSHPNDGRVDVVSAASELGIQQRRMARARLRLGTHVPHPQITTRQHAATTLLLGGETPLWLDNERWGSARHLDLAVEPDAFIVCV